MGNVEKEVVRVGGGLKLFRHRVKWWILVLVVQELQVLLSESYSASFSVPPSFFYIKYRQLFSFILLLSPFNFQFTSTLFPLQLRYFQLYVSSVLEMRALSPFLHCLSVRLPFSFTLSLISIKLTSHSFCLVFFVHAVHNPVTSSQKTETVVPKEKRKLRPTLFALQPKKLSTWTGSGKIVFIHLSPPVPHKLQSSPCT